MSETKKNKYIQPSKIVVDYSGVEGIGVFATQDIKEGEIIERCPMVKLGWRSNYVHDPVIWKYFYTQPKCDCSDCKNHGFSFWMVLGYGMIYNHQDIPNTKWHFDYTQAYADVIASKDIKAKEEIFVTYGPNYFKNRKKIDTSVPKTTPVPEIELEDDETFMSKIEALLKENTTSNKTKTPEQIQDETLKYGKPLP